MLCVQSFDANELLPLAQNGAELFCCVKQVMLPSSMSPLVMVCVPPVAKVRVRSVPSIVTLYS